MRPFHENLAGRLLSLVARALEQYPWWCVLPQLILLVGCLFLTTTRLQFSTSRSDLISSENKHQQNLLRYQKEFLAHETLVAVVESSDREKNRAFVERLAVRLRQEPDYFVRVYFKGDLRLMGKKALLFLPEKVLEELRNVLVNNRTLIQTFSKENTLNGVLDQVARQFQALGGIPRNSNSIESLSGVLPTLQRMIQQANDSIRQATLLPAPGVTALFGNENGDSNNGLYLTFAGGRIYLVTAEAKDASVLPAAIHRMRELLQETQRELPGVNAGITGEPVLEQDEMVQARRDTEKAALLSLILSVLIFVYGYHEVRRPLIATVCLLVGIGYTLGFATLVVGRLNLLSLTLVPILIGVAIDFGVHLITRFEEELRRGKDRAIAVRNALIFTGLGIFTSAFTTAGAFFAMMLTDFQGIREMGLISGAGLIVCLIPMMTLLPFLLVRTCHNSSHGASTTHRVSRRERLEQLYMRHPRWVLAAGVVLTGVALSLVPRVRFDYNLLNLQTRDLPAVGMEQKLIQSGSQSLLYGVIVAESLQAAVDLEATIQQLPTVATVISMARYLTENQDRKLESIREIKREIFSISLPELDRNPVDLRALGQTVDRLRRYVRFGLGQIAAEATFPRLETSLRELLGALDSFSNALETQHHNEAQTRLTSFQQSFFQDLIETVSILRAQEDRGRLLAEDLPPDLHDRFISPAGRFLLQIYPKENVWLREPQEQFVRELRQIDPAVTGSPVQFYEYTTMVKDGFQKAAGYASAVIAFVVFLQFRRIGSVALAFLPVILGSCWTLGIMGYLDIPFNPVNIMALTLVIGIGVTNGIHILNRYAEEAQPTILARSTGKAVLVSALTTMAGFGSLMVAQHQGIASLGKVMLIGTAMCLLASLALMPAVLDLLSRFGWTMTRKRKPRRQPRGGSN